MKIIFTLHAKERMKKRGLTEEEIIHAINNPDRTYKEDGKYYVQKNIGRAKIEIIFEKEKYIKVITIYYI